MIAPNKQDCGGTRLLRVCPCKLLRREQFEDVAIRIAKVDTTPATSMIEVHIRYGIRLTSIGYALGFDAREDRIEVVFADLKRIMMNLELRAVGEVER